VNVSTITTTNDHYTGLSTPKAKNRRILLEQSFTAYIPLMTATNTIRLWEDTRVLLNGVTNEVTVNWQFVVLPHHCFALMLSTRQSFTILP